MNIEGSVVVVTGGGGGIGAGLAEAFVEHGARVAITDINRAHVEAEAARIGGGTLALEHDVTSVDSWAAVRSAVETAFGPVGVLCNNAGISLPFKPLEEVSDAEFARVMAINVTGVFNGCRAFVPAMKARRAGHIVNTSSVNGMLPHGTFAAYTASKFAVAGMSEALRQELQPFGVGVSILYPGLTRSRMSEEQVPDLPTDRLEQLRARMMEPVWLGRAVVRAIIANELHVVTHPDHRPQLEERCAGLLAAHRQPAQPGYGGGPLPIG